MKPVDTEAESERAGGPVWLYKKKKAERAEQLHAAWNRQFQAQKQTETITRRAENRKLAELECVVPMTSREEYYDRKERNDRESEKLDLLRAEANKKRESRILQEKDVFRMVFGGNSNLQEPYYSEYDEEDFLEPTRTPFYRQFREGVFYNDTPGTSTGMRRSKGW